jgi:hypothetical protein
MSQPARAPIREYRPLEYRPLPVSRAFPGRHSHCPDTRSVLSARVTRTRLAVRGSAYGQLVTDRSGCPFGPRNETNAEAVRVPTAFPCLYCCVDGVDLHADKDDPSHNGDDIEHH